MLLDANAISNNSKTAFFVCAATCYKLENNNRYQKDACSIVKHLSGQSHVQWKVDTVLYAIATRRWQHDMHYLSLALSFKVNHAHVNNRS